MPGENQRRMILQELIRRSNNENRRLKGLEQRVETLENMVSNLENSLINKTQKINDRFADLNAKIKEIETQITRYDSIFEKLNREAPKYARKRDIKELESMLDFLNPLSRQFVTQKKLKRSIKKLEMKYIKGEKE